MRRRLTRLLAAMGWIALGATAAAGSLQPATSASLAPSHWVAAPADGVELALAGDVDERGRPALRLDYDFRGHGGWAAARLPLAIALPENYDLRFRYRAAGATNTLELKLIDDTGDNVWWNVTRELPVSSGWASRRIPRRAITFAWGPSSAPLTRIAAIELAITAGEGGRGSLWISELELVARPPVHEYRGRPIATASAEAGDGRASLALDGDLDTAWHTAGSRAQWMVDFGEPRELGGLTLSWSEGGAPAALRIELSDDGVGFSTAIDLRRAGARRNDVPLPETETRFVRLTLERPADADRIALAEFEVRSLAFGASTSAFLTTLADEVPRGTYPRALTEGSLWTVVGIDGDTEEALVSEDGAIEAGERSFSLEPFLDLGQGPMDWSRGETSRSLLDGDLPIPTVERKFPGGALTITSLATGEVGRSTIRVRYTVAAPPDRPLLGRLLLAVRPFQVNPPQQFLNVAGGAAPITTIACEADGVLVDGRSVLHTSLAASRCGAAAFAEGQVAELLREGGFPPASSVEDPQRLATALLEHPLRLAAGEQAELVVELPFPDRPLAVAPPAFAVDLERERRIWRAKVDRVRIEAPTAAAATLAAIRSSLAYILIHRDGAAIQPGSRAYARSWIRDGALTGAALLRLGHEDAVAEFARWFAPFQYADGKVPCCVDRRGADPVPENDSHGELIHLIAEVYRFTGDRAFLDSMFPHVRRAVNHLETLRQSRRTERYRSAADEIFFGLLPESISHEGYSAKAMHSYWDDTFADVGFSDAADLAQALGEQELASLWRARGGEFRADLLRSIERVRAAHGLATIPASAELGDFDSTSTTTMLDPGSLQPALSREALAATFERFYSELTARRDGSREWTGFTPYEVRHVGAFVRLGWRERATELLAYYLSVRRPAEWNQWPEAYARNLRSRQFLGDLPHGWVASDFIRSALDLFAYERREDRSLVLAAGIPSSWLVDGDRIAVRDLRTAWGPLHFTLERRERRILARVEALDRNPEGGLVIAPPGVAPRSVTTLPAELEWTLEP